jgi:hypothetical protein
MLLGLLSAAALLADPSTSRAGDSVEQTNRPSPCNLSKTNRSCTIVIDRQNPIAPSTLQMYSGETLTVIVENPFPYERYFLDYTTSAATLTPDVTSSIVQGLFPSLSATVFSAQVESAFSNVKPPKAGPDPCENNGIVTGQIKPPHGSLQRDGVPPFRACLSRLLDEARQQYKEFEPFVAPDSITPLPVVPKKPASSQPSSNNSGPTGDSANTAPTLPLLTCGPKTPEDWSENERTCLIDTINVFLQREFAASANIGTLAGDNNYKDKDAVKEQPAKPAKPATPGHPAVPAQPFVPAQPAISVDPSDAEAITELTSMQKAVDAIAADLLGYRQRLEDLKGFQNQIAPSEQAATCVQLTSKTDDPSVYSRMVSRTVTYSLDALNLVSNSQEGAPDPTKKRALASVGIVFADAPAWKKSSGASEAASKESSAAFRWEASAGVLISTLANRSYSVAPTYNGTTVTDNTVFQSTTRPTAVPFAAANYRLTDDDLPGRWKSNFYLTLALGVNPNTKTADFAVGPSLSWRAFMVSAFVHAGHETELTQGFTNHESLGAAFTGSLPTDTHWKAAFAIAFSVRVPALTGR